MDWESFYNNFRAPGFIPGYEIQNRLGGGAFGDVYKARKQSIGKAYAVKFLKIEDDAQRDAVERELAQVRHFAVIDHPNLVTIEDLGTVMGVPYLIMGYAGEDTLARRLKAGNLAREQALLYFVQTARGVLALHDRRLVHFDLKPSNVFLKGDVARVGDYGLSKLLTDGRMTLSFGRGTPQYMAPEMLRNRADHRADIYSMGVILYESLSGKLPFEGDSGAGLVLRETDDPPAFPEDFPATLRPVVERCLRLDPDDRFANVGELLDELGQSARQGDSVAFDWAGVSPGDTVVRQSAGTPGSDSADGETTPTPTSGSSNEELRQTAAELARGAVEVARGVWDGLRSASSQSAEGLRGAGEGIKEAGAQLSAAGASVKRAAENVHSGVSGLRDELARKRESSRNAPEGETPPTPAGAPATPSFGLGQTSGSRAVSGTHSVGAIPVPPRVDGGLLGTVFSTLVLSLEVLVSLVGNVLRGSVRFSRSFWEHLVRTSGGMLRRAVRFAFFLLVMSVMGFGLMTIGMLLIGTAGA